MGVQHDPTIVYSFVMLCPKSSFLWGVERTGNSFCQVGRCFVNSRGYTQPSWKHQFSKNSICSQCHWYVGISPPPLRLKVGILMVKICAVSGTVRRLSKIVARPGLHCRRNSTQASLGGRQPWSTNCYCPFWKQMKMKKTMSHYAKWLLCSRTYLLLWRTSTSTEQSTQMLLKSLQIMDLFVAAMTKLESQPTAEFHLYQLK